MGHWVTIDGRHVLIEEDGGHSGTHNPITHTGSKTTDKALNFMERDAARQRLRETLNKMKPDSVDIIAGKAVTRTHDNKFYIEGKKTRVAIGKAEEILAKIEKV